MKPLTKIKGAIKLAAIGDALGWITEFEKSTAGLKQKYNTERIENFLPWEKKVGGRFWGHIEKIETGAYSDDTQLTLSVARSIQNDGKVNQEYFAEIELPAWLEYARGAGRTIKISAKKIQRKSASWHNNFYSIKKKKGYFKYIEAGANGAAMRILPIALVNVGNHNQMYNDIFANSIITHGHPRAIIGALLYGVSIQKMILYRKDDFDPIHYLTQLGNNIEKDLSLDNLADEKIKKWANKWSEEKKINFRVVYDDVVQEVLADLRKVYSQLKIEKYKDLLSELGCYAPETSGSGTKTVIAGIYLTLKHSSEPKEAVLDAVNSLGADTDSIAAFAGGLVGSLHGHNIIPDKWRMVQDMNYLDKVAERINAIGFEDQSKTVNNVISKSDFQAKYDKLITQFKTLDLEEGSHIEYLPLGTGKVIKREIVDSFKKDKSAVIYKVEFDSGQLCTFSYILDVIK